MTTRRDFIGGMTGAMAGVAFVGCELMHTTHAHAQPAPRRREVVVNGRRVKTVDVHAHCAFPEAMALMGLKVNPETLVMGAERIKAMDEQGIDVEALSINAYWYKADRDLGAAAHQAAEREAGRAVRGAARPLRRLRLGRAAVSRTSPPSSSRTR